MLTYLWNFRVRKINLLLLYFLYSWMDPEGPAASVWPQFPPFPPLFFWYLWRYRQGICRLNHTMGVTGWKCSHALSSWSSLLKEGDFSVHWGCRNRIPLKAELKEQGAHSLSCFLGKAVLLYSCFLHSTWFCLILLLVWVFLFACSHLTSISFSSSDAESEESVPSFQDEFDKELGF